MSDGFCGVTLVAVTAQRAGVGGITAGVAGGSDHSCTVIMSGGFRRSTVISVSTGSTGENRIAAIAAIGSNGGGLIAVTGGFNGLSLGVTTLGTAVATAAVGGAGSSICNCPRSVAVCMSTLVYFKIMNRYIGQGETRCTQICKCEVLSGKPVSGGSLSRCANKVVVHGTQLLTVYRQVDHVGAVGIQPVAQRVGVICCAIDAEVG